MIHIKTRNSEAILKSFFTFFTLSTAISNWIIKSDHGAFISLTFLNPIPLLALLLGFSLSYDLNHFNMPHKKKKTWFFQKINKIDKPLAILVKKENNINEHPFFFFFFNNGGVKMFIELNIAYPRILQFLFWVHI